MTRFDIADMVRQVVGVGSVGMRVYLVLLVERRTGDPFFLQISRRPRRCTSGSWATARTVTTVSE